MNFLNLLKNFRDDESGAVTVDWVVLAAAIVLLGSVVLAAIRTATGTLAQNIATAIGKVNVE
ncbi:Flp family type IVb pilin [Parasulfitobacter algicola]|uniref:Pilus assembly protein n=1 Tax=Parasulfitobacter algicola TaxID=2614809 RepID=A0ABX2ISX0_9RHOB|nr:hypothetical protein [Sulfitobacter algicola]NSX55999.1 hypothetical protein [Sulfitobacter algicola]